MTVALDTRLRAALARRALLRSLGDLRGNKIGGVPRHAGPFVSHVCTVSAARKTLPNT